MVTNPTVATALGKIMFAVIEPTRGTYNSAVYSSANAVFLNAPAIPSQPLRKLDSRQQRKSFSKFSRIPNRYGVGTLPFDVNIKPSGVLGDVPHGDQLLHAWWGKRTIVAVTSVKYEPAPISSLFPSLTLLIKYGHKVYLLVGSVVQSANIDGKADESDSVIAALTGTIGFLRKYWVGKDELSAIAATGAATVTVKNAKKFAYGLSASPSVGMKVQFRTVAGVLDDNSGAGYTISSVDTTTNVIGISPVLAGAGLAADDIIEGFVPSPTDVGEEVPFYLGGVTHGVSGSEVPWTIVGMNYSMENPFVKILDFEKSGSPYPTRIVDAGGTGALRNAMAEVEYVMNEDDTDLDYVAENQIPHVLKTYWGDTAGERFYIQLNQAELEATTESGDQEVHGVTAHTALATGGGDNEAFMMFD